MSIPARLHLAIVPLHPNVSFAIIQMGAPATLLTDGFNRSSAMLAEAAQKLNPASGMSSYREALSLAEITLENDMNTDKSVPNERTCYNIFLLSDSMPEAGATVADIKDDLSSIMSLQTGHGVMELRLHTALLIDPGVNVQPDLLTDLTSFLKAVADVGQGTFTDYHASEAIDFRATIPP